MRADSKFKGRSFYAIFAKNLILMKLTATTRLIAACLMLISLLFTQLAVASYVCPTVPSKAVTENFADVSSQAASSPCHHQDMNNPGLCHAHASDSANKLSLDKPDVPDVPVFLPVRMAQTIHVSGAASAAHHIAIASRIELPSSAPPNTILHCCFRI